MLYLQTAYKFLSECNCNKVRLINNKNTYMFTRHQFRNCTVNNVHIKYATYLDSYRIRIE